MHASDRQHERQSSGFCFPSPATDGRKGSSEGFTDWDAKMLHREMSLYPEGHLNARMIPFSLLNKSQQEA